MLWSNISDSVEYCADWVWIVILIYSTMLNWYTDMSGMIGSFFPFIIFMLDFLFSHEVNKSQWTHLNTVLISRIFGRIHLLANYVFNTFQTIYVILLFIILYAFCICMEMIFDNALVNQDLLSKIILLAISVWAWIFLTYDTRDHAYVNLLRKILHTMTWLT